MANPSTRWDSVPIFAFYFSGDDVTPSAGYVEFSVTQRITRADGRVIYPEGAKVRRTIGDHEADPGVRDAVRAAWRAADEAALGAAFVGADWDAWWAVMLTGSVFVSFPASDDPDIVQTGYQVKVKESLTSGSGREYYVAPVLAQLDLIPPGINLGLIEVPPGSPIVPAPVFAKGLAYGVAPLDGDALIPLEFLPAGTGGGGGIPAGGITDADVAATAAIAASKIAGLAGVATSGAYGDLTGVAITNAAVAANAAISLDKTADASDRKAMTAAERTKLTATPAAASIMGVQDVRAGFALVDSFGDATATDAQRIQLAMDYAALQPYKPALLFSNRKYSVDTTTSEGSFVGTIYGKALFRPPMGVHWCSLTKVEREYTSGGARGAPGCVIEFDGTNPLIELPGVAGVTTYHQFEISGIQFNGKATGSGATAMPKASVMRCYSTTGAAGQRGDLPNPTWAESTLDGFGVKNVLTFYHGATTGSTWQRFNMQNCKLEAFQIGGSDMYIGVGGHCYINSGLIQPGLGMVRFTHLSASVVENMYITPTRAAYGLRFDGGWGTRFTNINVDSPTIAAEGAAGICQGSPVYINGGQSSWSQLRMFGAMGSPPSGFHRGYVSIHNGTHTFGQTMVVSRATGNRDDYTAAGTPFFWVGSNVTGNDQVKAWGTVGDNTRPVLLQKAAAGVNFLSDDTISVVA